MQTIEPLDQLIEKIKDEFKKSEKPGQIIAEHMKDYLKQGHDDWKKYAFFCKHSYSRNLVHIDDNFEMIVLCWEEGQESPVHNHSVCISNTHIIDQMNDYYSKHDLSFILYVFYYIFFMFS